MNECQRLHETIVRDIYDVINDVKDFDQIEWIQQRNNTGSIARRASNLVLVFPVIVSNSINYQSAIMVSKAIERKCMTLMQILFSSAQFTNADNLRDYLKNFHSNLNLKSGFTLDDMIDGIDALAQEGKVEITDKEAIDAIREDMNNINFYLSTEYNKKSLNEYRIRKNIYGDSYITEAPIALTANTTPDYVKQRKDMYDIFNRQLTQAQCDKANELMPSTMIVNFIYKGDNGKPYQVNAVCGIKAKLYPVESMEIINRVVSKYKDSNGLFNLVRASTREISFFKDLAFMIDKAKIDAVNMSKESNNARLFKVLERRAAKNRFSTLLKKNDASPITSLVISQEEVEYLKKYNNIDMEKSYVTRSILEKYNLMDIMIVDETLEIVKSLFDDGDSQFELYTFDALEKQAKDNSYKKIVNLMSRLNH